MHMSYQEANIGREIVSSSEGNCLVVDAADSPYRVSAHGIHSRPRRTTYLAVARRTFRSGTGNTTGARRFIRFIDRRVGYLPAGHATRGGRNRGSGTDE